MEYLITDTQRAWQLKAREFAETEIRPLSLARDQIAEPAATFDWNIIKKGSAAASPSLTRGRITACRRKTIQNPACNCARNWTATPGC